MDNPLQSTLSHAITHAFAPSPAVVDPALAHAHAHGHHAPGMSLDIQMEAPHLIQEQPQSQDGQTAKRRPGRPKGSTKKNLLAGTTTIPPKIKRPVGRPRKDGFPAGSVGPTRMKRERQGVVRAYISEAREQPFINVLQMQFPSTPVSNMGYPGVISYNAFPNGTLHQAAPAGSPTLPERQALPYNIDPSLDRDEWATLAETDRNQFLSTLLSAFSAPNPVSTAGPTVEEAFKSHLVSLSPNPGHAQSTPSLYSILKTFWLPSSPVYFALTASASTARTPSEHRFLYWDPQPLVFNGISCPSCGSPLINRGRISSGPVKVYDIEKPFFIVGCEYACTSQQCVAATSSQEGRKFASTDSSILRALPPRLKDEFPAKLIFGDADAGSGPDIWNWEAFGVSVALWNMVLGSLRAGLKKDAILSIVRAVQHGVPEMEHLNGHPQVQTPQPQMLQEPHPPAPSTPAMAHPQEVNQMEKMEADEQQSEEAPRTLDQTLEEPTTPDDENSVGYTRYRLLNCFAEYLPAPFRGSVRRCVESQYDSRGPRRSIPSQPFVPCTKPNYDPHTFYNGIPSTLLSADARVPTVANFPWSHQTDNLLSDIQSLSICILFLHSFDTNVNPHEDKQPSTDYPITCKPYTVRGER